MSTAPRAAAIAAGVLALLWLAAFATVAIARVGHPFELDWMGGAFVDSVCRVLDGESLYVRPTADYVPFLYAPLYFYASAGVSLVLGEGFVPLRLVSIAATLGVLALAALWTRERSGSTAAAAIAAGTFAAGYFVVDTYYDTARADSLFLLLALAALVVLDLRRSARSAVLAAFLLVLAYLTKQTALVLAPPFAIAAALRAPRRGLVFGIAFAALLGVAFVAWNAATDAWFGFYTWTLPRRHQYDWSIAIDALTIDLRPLWPLLGVAIWLGWRRSRCGAVRELLADGAWVGGLLVAALSSRAHLGGAVNVLAPGILALGLAGGLAWHEARRGGGRARLIVPWLLVAQLALLAIDFGDRDDRHAPRLLDPARWIPTAADREAGEHLVAMLRDADGEVLVPWHGYLARMAGKRGSAHVMAIIDLETDRSGEPELWERLHREFLDSARARDAAIVLLEEDLGLPKYRIGELVFPGYTIEPLAWADERVFRPVVGLHSRPGFVARRAR